MSGRGERLAGQMGEIPIDQVVIEGERRPLRNLTELAESIQQIGLLNPITVNCRNGNYGLIAGYHRLEACRSLGWTHIPATIVDHAGLLAELAEIDENLRRSELSVLEEGEYLVRRHEVLAELGHRAPAYRPEKGAESAPSRTTAEIANERGMSKRTAQKRK